MQDQTSPVREEINLIRESLKEKRAFDFLKIYDLPPKPRRTGVIEIRGPYYTSVTFGYHKGHPKNPMTNIEIENKFRNLTSRYFESSKCGKVLKLLWNLEKLEDVSSLLRSIAIPK